MMIFRWILGTKMRNKLRTSDYSWLKCSMFESNFTKQSRQNCLKFFLGKPMSLLIIWLHQIAKTLFLQTIKQFRNDILAGQ